MFLCALPPVVGLPRKRTRRGWTATLRKASRDNGLFRTYSAISMAEIGRASMGFTLVNALSNGRDFTRNEFVRN
eukprot:4174201-Pyramimonas_sp.AAC.3